MPDRLIRGRAWIGLVAFALIGIVTLQLGLLQLNSRIGRDLRRETVLQRENASLGIENAELAAAERIEALASRSGMRGTPESALRFLDASHRGALAKALAALHTAVGQGAAATGSEVSGASGTAVPSGSTGASGAAVPSGSTGASGAAVPGTSGASVPATSGPSASTGASESGGSAATSAESSASAAATATPSG